MKIVVMSSFPMSKIFGNKLDLFELNKHFDIEFWDVSGLFFEKDKLTSYYESNFDYQFRGPNHKIISEKNELFNLMVANKQAVFWYLSRFFKNLDDGFLIKKMNKYNLKYLFQYFFPIPFDTKFPALNILRIIKHMVFAFQCKPYAVVTSGNVGSLRSKILYPFARVVMIPSLAIDWEPSKLMIEGEYIVYVDETIASSPDGKIYEKANLSSDIEGFYTRLKRFLDVVESYYKIKVIVAASGKFNYENPHDYFGNREVIYEKTFSLIDGAKFVLGHFSAALDQVIISKKILVLLSDDSFTDYAKKIQRIMKIKLMHKNCNLIDLNNLAEIPRLANANQSNYVKVKEEYFLTDNSSENSYFKIMCEFFKSV